MSIIGWIVIGALVGVAAALVGGHPRSRRLVSVPIGAIGGVVGGWVAEALELIDAQEFLEVEGSVAALIGAGTMLVAYRLGARPL